MLSAITYSWYLPEQYLVLMDCCVRNVWHAHLLHTLFSVPAAKPLSTLSMPWKKKKNSVSWLISAPIVSVLKKTNTGWNHSTQPIPISDRQTSCTLLTADAALHKCTLRQKRDFWWENTFFVHQRRRISILFPPPIQCILWRTSLPCLHAKLFERFVGMTNGVFYGTYLWKPFE